MGTKSETVVVTGGAGFAASQLCHKLVAAGYHVRALDVDARVRDLQGVEAKIVDLQDKNLLMESFRGAIAVFHLGAVVPFGFVDNVKKKRLWNVNVTGTKNVVEACIEENVQSLIFSSSTGVVFSGDPIAGGDETLAIPSTFNCLYSASKALAEQEVLGANGRQLKNGSTLKTIALRPNGIWGPGEQHHIPLLLSAAAVGGHIIGFAKGAKTDFTHRENLCHACMLALKGLQSPSQTCSGKAYFITDGGAYQTVEHFTPLLVSLGFWGPLLWLPGSLLWPVAFFCELLSYLLGPSVLNFSNMKPFLTQADVRKLVHDNYYVCQRAKEDLGYEPIVCTAPSCPYSLETSHIDRKAGKKDCKSAFLTMRIVAFLEMLYFHLFGCSYCLAC
mmetsp:Transcript_33920/g.87092  ORF Transcript_33920/g.87092 Transcript_33920/m.87092 type:complete len:388 (-) Transcript_33920:1014-2177(-)